MKQEELEALIHRSQTGDRQAQEQLVLAVQDRVYYHCRKMLKNQEDAMDAAQDILLAMLTSLGSLRQSAAFWSWLNRMTSNICLKRLARNGRELPLREEEPGGGPVLPPENLDDQTVPDRALDNEESRRMVVELVEALPETQRLSVLFYYYDEMSIKEIAEVMETSENTVKSRLYYARDAIRKGVEKYAADGFKLYGLTPVPFLRYFLQQEAAEAAGALAGRAALAAAASAGGGTAITAALTRLLGGSQVQKGLVALAGLALAGAVTGTVLLHRPGAPVGRSGPEAGDVPRTPPVTEREDLAFTPETSEPETPPPVPREPLVTPPVWVGPAPPPQEETPGPASLPPEELPPEPTVPEPGPAPQDQDMDQDIPPLVTIPALEWIPERGGSTGNRGDGGGSGSSPEPEDPVVPPAASVQYEPNPDFGGDYLGETAEGVHEFLLSIRMPDQPEPTDTSRFPLRAGNFYSRLEIVNPLIVRANGTFLYASQEGTTDVRYYVSEKAEGPYILAALVHVTVLRSHPMEINTADYIRTGATEEGVPVLRPRAEVHAHGGALPSPLAGEWLFTKLESEDPSVAAVVPETNGLRPVFPGTTLVQVFTSYHPERDWTLTALVELTVLPPLKGTELCTPREDFGPENGAEGTREAGYQGIDAQGRYAFTVTVRQGGVFRLRPLLESDYPTSAIISDSTRVAAEGATQDTFRALDSGDTDITLLLRPEGGTDLIPCAVIHVHVLPVPPPYSPNPDFGECLGRDEQDVWQFRVSLQAGGSGLPCPLAEGSYFLRAVSGDPGVAAVREGLLYPLAPGNTQVRYYVSTQEEGGYILQALVTVEVTAPPPEEPEVPPLPPDAEIVNRDVASFGQASGYGCNDRFSYLWPGVPLPAVPEYRSLTPDVAVINERGYFTTLSAGKAVLAAWDPADPSVCYTLTLQVEDHFDWQVSVSGSSVYVGGQDYCLITFYAKDYETEITDIRWASGNPELLTVTPHENNYFRCNLLGLAAGTATVTGTAHFSLVTAAGQLVEMTDTFSLRVYVMEPPQEEVPQEEPPQEEAPQEEAALPTAPAAAAGGTPEPPAPAPEPCDAEQDAEGWYV